MNLNKLKKRGFEVSSDTVKYAAKQVRSVKERGDTVNLVVSVEENGRIYLEEEIILEGGFMLSGTTIFVGEVNSIEQFLVFYDVLNACNTNGNHKL